MEVVEDISKSEKLFISSIDDERPIKVEKKGPNSLVPSTVLDVFKQTVNKYGDKTALFVKIENNWRGWTWSEYYEEVMRAARSLAKIGVNKFDTTSIIGFNSPEWVIAYMATISAGGVATGIYTTNKEESCLYIASHSNSKVVFVENEVHLQKFLKVRHELPNLKLIVQWSGKYEKIDGVIDWNEFMSIADEEDEQYQKVVEERIAGLRPTQCCSLIYTSGTTGNPKACMLSHDNLVWTAHIVMRYLNFSTEEKSISYLPLSHIAAQLVDIHIPLACGSTVYFAQNDALKGSLSTTLKEVRPTLFLSVPRVYEKIQLKIQETIAKSNPIKRKLMSYALSKGKETHHELEQKGYKGETPFTFNVMKKLVYDKVRETLGLDRTRMLVSAAAPISSDTVEFFLGLNLPICEIYGMSECCGPQSITSPETRRSGSAGISLPGTEMKIHNPDETGEGEVCFRGRHIMLGYKDNEEETAKIIDEDGFLHSGDLGRIDSDGYLTITGRLKELIITAGGENVPPVIIEEFLKKELGKVISNVIVIGDKRQFLSCLFTLKCVPKTNPAHGEYPFEDNLALETIEELKRIGSHSVSVSQALNDPKIRKYIEDGIKVYNQQAVSRAQNIAKFEILPKDFTVEGEELTATMKLKRKVVIEKYSDIIDRIYDVGPSTNI